tara:strand:- start:1864 stop:2226 length:363 start_codon:yes stop_codon:yes gene_type:complete
MGTITMSVGPQLGESIDNEINTTSFVESTCTTTFGFDVIVTADSWIEWTASSGVTVTGGVSGEIVLVGTHSYTGTIIGFKSPSTAQNTITSNLFVKLKDSSAGATLDNLTISRVHSSENC